MNYSYRTSAEVTSRAADRRTYLGLVDEQLLTVVEEAERGVVESYPVLKKETANKFLLFSVFVSRYAPGKYRMKSISP